MRIAVYDFGRSTCRGALVVDGARADSVERRTQGSAIDVDGEASVTEALRWLADQLGSPEAERAAIGLAGVGQAPGLADQVTEVLRELHGVDAPLVATDLTCAHVGALEGRPGVVVLAGTGAAALAISAEGRPTQVDGYGYLVGDAGSGFDVGRAGLSAALRARDGRGRQTRLVDAAERRFGPLEQLPAHLHDQANQAREIAAFAPAVAVAARAGDEVAASIWADAARELAHTAATAVAALRPADDEQVEVSWSGGLFTQRDVLLHPMRDELAARAPQAVLVPPAGDELDGAARLAELRTTYPIDRLVHRGGEEGDRDGNRPGRDAASPVKGTP